MSLNATRKLADDLQLSVGTTFAYNKNTIEKVSSKPTNAVEYARNPLYYYREVMISTRYTLTDTRKPSMVTLFI